MLPASYSVPAEKPRLSRRSHKNSKDGCPNCRANRIKCSEDLPSCLQCTKKNLRCGYFDFPPERLRYIQRKNDMLRSQLSNETDQHKDQQKPNFKRQEPRNNMQPPATIPVPPVYRNAYPMQPPQSMGAFTQPPAFPPTLPSPGGTVYHMRYNTPIHMPHVSQIPSVPPAHTVGRAPPIPVVPPVSSQISQLPMFMPQHYGADFTFPRVPPGPATQQYRMPLVPVTGGPRQFPAVSHSDTSSLFSSSSHSGTIPGRSGSIEDEQSLRSYSLPSIRSKKEPMPTKQVKIEHVKHDLPQALGNNREAVSPRSDELAQTDTVYPHRSKHGRKRIKVMDGNSAPRRKSESLSTYFRSVVYSNMFRDVTHDLELLEGDIPHDFMSWDDGQLRDIENFNPKNPFFSSEPSSLFDNHSDTAESFTIPDRASLYSSLSNFTSPGATPSVIPSPNDKFLPNCVMGPTKFKILKVPEKFRSNLFADTMKNLRKSGAHIQFSGKTEKKTIPPVLYPAEYSFLWVDVLLRATAFELFFIYFIDKSLNILMRASEKIVNSDIVYSPSSESSGSSSFSESMSRRQRYNRFFYNRDDLDILTAKSYHTYGRVIGELRNSINLYSPEFPTRLSLFSAWACYTNPQSNLDTFSLMIRGALVLMRNTLNQCLTENIPQFCLHQEFQIIETTVRQSLFPDYNFKVVENLVVDFENYKSVIEKFVALHEDGCDIDEDISAVVSDPIFRHDLHELNKFFDKLLNYFYPQIATKNRHFKAKNEYQDDENIYFASPSLLFKMTYDWFYSYPDEKVYMGSKINPLKKVLYMFYHALARSMSHAFTPLKSVSIVDACNITCVKVGMVFSKPEGIDGESYGVLGSILGNLIRTVRFFEIRSELLSYRVIGETVLEEDFIKAIPCATPSSTGYNDIVQILAPKIKVRERQIEDFSKTIFSAHHFPLFEELYEDPFTAEMIHTEIERQHDALQKEPYSLDYSTGLANHDFNPNKIVKHYCSKKRAELDKLSEIPHEKLSIRIDQMLKSRDAISSISKQRSDQET